MSGIVGQNPNRGSGIIGATAIADESVDSDAYVDASIDNAHLADDAVDSDELAAGSVDNAHLADDAVDSDELAAGAVDLAHMSAESVDSDQYVDGSIDTAHIATNQIDETLMKDAFVGDFTDATVTASDYFLHGDATDSGNTKKDTVQGILDLTGGGTTAATVQATTSGGSMDFTGIPSGTKRIDVILADVSSDGGNDYRVQIGDAGGIETSGYVCKSTGLVAGGVEGIGDQTDAFIMQMGQAGSVMSGSMSLFLVDASTFTWVDSHVAAKSGTNASVQGGGSKSLDAELTQLNLSLHATDFDAGKVNIHYWQ